MRLSNQTVVVTGGAGLLGESFVRSIAENGGIAIIADMNKDKSIKIATEINNLYKESRVIYFPLDITSEQSIKDFLKKCDCNNYTVTALVNNAYPKTRDFGKDFFEVEYQTFCTNLNMHLGGYFLVSKIFTQYFQMKGAGNIINIASIYGHTAPRFDIYEGTQMSNGPEYVAIKAGVIQFTKYMAKRFKGMNIRVNCIAPGGIWDHQPEVFATMYKKYCANKGMLSPEDLNGGLIFLLSDESKYMHGQLLTIDDGFSL